MIARRPQSSEPRRMRGRHNCPWSKCKCKCSARCTRRMSCRAIVCSKFTIECVQVAKSRRVRALSVITMDHAPFARKVKFIPFVDSAAHLWCHLSTSLWTNRLGMRTRIISFHGKFQRWALLIKKEIKIKTKNWKQQNTKIKILIESSELANERVRVSVWTLNGKLIENCRGDPAAISTAAPNDWFLFYLFGFYLQFERGTREQFVLFVPICCRYCALILKRSGRRREKNEESTNGTSAEAKIQCRWAMSDVAMCFVFKTTKWREPHNGHRAERAR